MARWLRAEFLQYSIWSPDVCHAGGLFILVDLLGVGVDGGRVGFVTGVGSGEGRAGLVVGVGVMAFGLSLVWGESKRFKVGGRGVFTSISILVGVMGGVVSFLGVWRGLGGGLVGGLDDVVVSSGGAAGGR